MLLLQCVDDLIIPALFSIIAGLFPNYSEIIQNTVASAIKIPKIIPT